MEKLDYKKAYPDLYMPKQTPSILTVPPMTFVMVDGKGNPNTSQDYQQAVAVLYGISFAIKMMKMGGNAPEGYFEYVVPPLEGLWTVADTRFDGVVIQDKEDLCWTAAIRQPEFVTEDVFQKAVKQLAVKKPELPVGRAKLVTWEEGLCAQVMHIGPYDDEPATLAKLDAYIAQQGYCTDITAERRHHEIYLGDPRKTAPQRLKTVLRHPIKKG